MQIERAKRAAGQKAAEFIESGMVVGLGTGTTVAYFIDRLIQRCQEGLSIRAVASSDASAEKARRGGIEVIELNEVRQVDLTVDGADEIDPWKRMIKGGGGAHVREKILATASSEMVVIVDEAKQVPLLGTAKLPVEILPFGSHHTEKQLQAQGYRGRWRRDAKGSLFVTDNQNFLFDLSFDTPLRHPEKEHETILQITGVVDTGFFFGLAGRVVVGDATGKTTVI